MTLKKFVLCGLAYQLVLFLKQVDQACANSKLENTALGKRAYQTDVRRGEARLAVDGRLSFYRPMSDHLCSETRTKRGSYWKVDLGAIHVIDHVIIFETLDRCCYNRLKDVELYTGLSQTSYKRIGYHPGHFYKSLRFQLDHPIHARWVKIKRRNGNAYLTICEVQVMGYKLRTLLYEHAESKTGSGAVISSAKSKSKVDCCRQCLHTSGCIGVNLHLDTMMCHLLDTKSKGASVDDQTALYIAKYTIK